MAIACLIMGESGTGKSTSMFNVPKDKACLINVSAKPLPFRGRFDETYVTDSGIDVIKIMAGTQKKIIVIDDAQYLMGFAEMRRRDEKGFQKFTDIGGSFFDVVNSIRHLPEDTIVYLLMHTETTPDGITKAKTSGQMLDKKITLEGMFSIVLRTEVSDGKYLFRTQNSGSDTVKSPIGLFCELTIPNDLQKVDSAIREYYGL